MPDGNVVRIVSYDPRSGLAKIAVKEGISVGFLFGLGIPIRFIEFKYRA
jgi:hypothetical protein